MNLLDAILNEQDGQVVQQIGAQHGLDASQTQSAIAALLPGLTGALQGQLASGAQSGGSGLEGLLGMLTGGMGQQYVEDPSLLGSQSSVSDGNSILGQILGNKDASRALANQASAQTGIGPDVLKQLLPVVASLAMGMLGRQTQQSNFGGNAAGLAPGDSGLGGLLGMLTPMLDSNRDGSIADDVLGMAARMFQK